MIGPDAGATATFDTKEALQDAVGRLLERTNVFVVDTVSRTISGSHATIAAVLEPGVRIRRCDRPVFVLHGLMRSIDTDESSDFNRSEYHCDSQAEPFPQRHRQYQTTWCGMAVGMTTRPTEILTFAEYHPSRAELDADGAAGRAQPQRGWMTRLKCISRLRLERTSIHDQATQVLSVLDFYRPQTFAMDTTGAGLPLFQIVRERSARGSLLDSVKGYSFAAKAPEQLATSVLEFSTDTLRQYIDLGRLLLPYDRDLVGQFERETFRYGDHVDDSGRLRRIFAAEGQALNAARMAVMAHALAGQ